MFTIITAVFFSFLGVYTSKSALSCLDSSKVRSVVLFASLVLMSNLLKMKIKNYKQREEWGVNCTDIPHHFNIYAQHQLTSEGKSGRVDPQ